MSSLAESRAGSGSERNRRGFSYLPLGFDVPGDISGYGLDHPFQP